MAEKTLDVLLADAPVGVLTQRTGGRHAFEYLGSWQKSPRAIQLSYSMPLQQDRHGTRVVTDFMWGLLPDNENALRRWGTRYKVSPHNPFTLLAAVGEDCPGAVQIVPPDHALKGRQRLEDMCQALATREKYQQHGGPGIHDIMGLLQFSDRPDIDRDRFMRAQAFNYLIAGPDAHARNYSISYAPGGAFRLSPLYDVISDLPYNARGSALAMTIGGKRVIAHIKPHHWSRQAASARFSRDALFGHVRDLIAVLPEAAERVGEACRAQGLRFPVVNALARGIARRCRDLARIYGAEAMQPVGTPHP